MQKGIDRVPRRRLYENIVQQFHSLIRREILQHGARLPSERSLASQFKVSRSSVREAIRSLELQGLVVSKRGAGTFVSTENLDSMLTLIATTLSSGYETLRDIFEMRHLLEPQIAAVAAQRATPEEVERLAKILEDQQEQISNGHTIVDADTAFHFALASATHNSALIKVVNTMEDILRRSRDHSLQERGRPQRSLASHRQVLNMVEAHDTDGARQAMEYHLTSVEPAILLNTHQHALQNISETSFEKEGMRDLRTATN